MGDEPARRFLCARCRAPVLVCSRCDWGQIYCATGCAAVVRQQSQREAGRRYQGDLRGRFRHAARTQRWRERQALLAAPPDGPEMATPQSVTHQGSPLPASDAVLVAVPTPVAAAASPVVAPAASAPPAQPCKTITITTTTITTTTITTTTTTTTTTSSASKATTPTGSVAEHPTPMPAFTSSAWRCHWCHTPCAARVRLDFLRHSRSSRPRRRTSARVEPSHGHSP